MRLNDFILEKIKEQGFTQKYIAEQINVKYNSFNHRMRNDSLTAYDILKIGRLLNIDLEKEKHNIKEGVGKNENEIK